MKKTSRIIAVCLSVLLTLAVLTTVVSASLLEDDSYTIAARESVIGDEKQELGITESDTVVLAAKDDISSKLDSNADITVSISEFDKEQPSIDMFRWWPWWPWWPWPWPWHGPFWY
ncbi:MAG: hypothetical protein FWH57_08875 [Oscillospiraceae bacterium]|nr:hypothetical protein [Oscillospiraceae bacterium]